MKLLCTILICISTCASAQVSVDGIPFRNKRESDYNFRTTEHYANYKVVYKHDSATHTEYIENIDTDKCIICTTNVLEFDKNDYLIKEVLYDNCEFIVQSREYTNDSSGRELSCRLVVYGQPSCFGYYIYPCNDGYMSAEEHYKDSSVLNYIYDYDSTGKCVRYTFIENDFGKGDVKIMHDYVYDNKNRVSIMYESSIDIHGKTPKTSYYIDGRLVMHKTTYTYDDSGKVTE